ncbi:MAG: tRNA (guanosine(37)-N1)-methyltransferase TrmD [Lentisphaerae bacterium GWF2_57_35]|nr:MAG: tRNA (guanosine(37)-N1)-methyltransferase TrmD [Lentisphaerae bacterium GWF2_57_35]
MSEPLEIDVVTIFPQMLGGFLNESMLKRAAQSGAVRFSTINLRDFTTDPHRTTDDRPYGGGPGMVMKPEPVFQAVESVRKERSRVILMTPQGRRFNQAMARELSRESHLVFVCGHYEGVDERIREVLVTDEISIGDYVLTNGVLPAAVVIDAVVRLLPGVLGGEGATVEESFSENTLEYPQYTRPAEFRGMKVPDILSSGHHEAIARWRAEQSLQRTRERRPDLLDGTDASL